jgi:hypothetical protein
MQHAAKKKLLEEMTGAKESEKMNTVLDGNIFLNSNYVFDARKCDTTLSLGDTDRKCDTDSKRSETQINKKRPLSYLAHGTMNVLMVLTS